MNTLSVKGQVATAAAAAALTFYWNTLWCLKIGPRPIPKHQPKRQNFKAAALRLLNIPARCIHTLRWSIFLTFYYGKTCLSNKKSTHSFPGEFYFSHRVTVCGTITNFKNLHWYYVQTQIKHIILIFWKTWFAGTIEIKLLWYRNYRQRKKLREGNVFTGVRLSTWGVGLCHRDPLGHIPIPQAEIPPPPPARETSLRTDTPTPEQRPPDRDFPE